MSSPYALGPLERDILQVVWKKQRASVQDVLLSLNSCPTKNLAYTTVMTIMSRLVEKGVLKRAKEGRCYYYTTAEPKKAFIHEQARQVIQNFADRFGPEAINAFVCEAKKMAASEKKVDTSN